LWRDFSVRQDPLCGRAAHTECGLYLLRASLAAALLGARRVSARRGWAGEMSGLFEHPAAIVSSAHSVRSQRCIVRKPRFSAACWQSMKVICSSSPKAQTEDRLKLEDLMN